MNVLIIGGAGRIGQHIVEELSANHQVRIAGLNSNKLQCDYTNELSLHRMFRRIDVVEHVVCVVGGDTIYKKFDQLTDNNWRYMIERKLFSQILVAKISEMYMKNGGSITLTSGYHSHYSTSEIIGIDSVNAALEAFVIQFSSLLNSDIRINVVSPTPVTNAELTHLNKFCPMTQIVGSYIDSIEGDETGKIFRPWDGLYSQNVLPQLYERAA